VAVKVQVGYTPSQMKVLYRAAIGSVIVLACILTIVVANRKNLVEKPFFREDLHAFGFPTESPGRITGNFSNINFLSDDLVLVTVNTRDYGPMGPIIVNGLLDEPPSELLLFDISQRTLVKRTEMPVEKDAGSVRAIRGDQFALLNKRGLHLCSPELKCQLVLVSEGPLFVSPQGTRVAVGGNGQTPQQLLDTTSLKVLDQFAWQSPAVIPGDTGLLIRQGEKLNLRFPGKRDQPLPFGGGGVWPEARFLSDTTVADFESEKALAVARIDGNVLFREPVIARWRLAELATTASGTRFCFHEAGYTVLNSVANFLDVESSRPYDFESVKVISVDSGKALFELQWDPRPFLGYLTTPALSPDGHRLALIRGGYLEIFAVP